MSFHFPISARGLVAYALRLAVYCSTVRTSTSNYVSSSETIKHQKQTGRRVRDIALLWKTEASML